VSSDPSDRYTGRQWAELRLHEPSSVCLNQRPIGLSFEQNDPAATRPPAHETLYVALLLTAAGGFLDAFTWIAHGHVFANAQTANIVLLGLFAALGQWSQSLRHVPPIVAFILGVLTAYRLRIHASKSGKRREVLFSLVVEIVSLSVVAALPPHFSDVPIVLVVAFVAALQSSSFSRVEGFAYSSVMATGNLRWTFEPLVAGSWRSRDAQALHQASVFGAICATFAVGAGLGAFFTTRLVNAALVVPIVLLFLALILCIRRPRDAAAS
jgi:uncharacterized membrane protein YoaK (UPF0700 family)